MENVDIDDYFNSLKLKSPASAFSNKKVAEPVFIYPKQLWPELSPKEAAFRFVAGDSFEDNLRVLASISTSDLSIPAKVVFNRDKMPVLIVSIGAEFRSYLNYQGCKLYDHKVNVGKKAFRLDEIGSATSEFAVCEIINLFAALCGFSKRVKPDFELKKIRDVGDVKIGTKIFDVKLRHDAPDFNAGWFTDADFILPTDTIGIYTAGCERWTWSDFANADMAYDLGIVGCFDTETVANNSVLKRAGERKVLDPDKMGDLKFLFSLFAQQFLKEEG